MTPSGRISLFDARTELGRTGRIGLLDPQVKMLGGNPAGRIGMFSLRNSQWISRNNYPNPNVYTPPANIASRLVIAPGTVIYGNSYDAYALAICPGNGADVTVDNYGTVMGAAGAPNGGVGGNAFYSYTGDNVTPGRSSTIHLRNFGSILAGGGGGGAGGQGGQGGGGYYVATAQDGGPYYSVPNTWAAWEWDPGGTIRRTRMMYSGSQIYDGFWTQANGVGSGGYTYYFGAYQYTTVFYVDNGYGGSSPPGGGDGG